MKTIIAGTRDILDYGLVREVVERLVQHDGWKITEVVSGAARGVDQMGETWANRNGIPIKQFPADWGGYAGKRAGFVRNVQMASYADALIAIWDGRSRGTAHMVQVAQERRLKIHIHKVST